MKQTMNIYEFLNRNLNSGLHYRVFPDKGIIEIYKDSRKLSSFSFEYEMDEIKLRNGLEVNGVVLFKTTSTQKINNVSNGKLFSDVNNNPKKRAKITISLYELANELEFIVKIDKSNSHLINKITYQGYPSNIIRNGKYSALYKYSGNYEYILYSIIDEETGEVFE